MQHIGTPPFVPPILFNMIPSVKKTRLIVINSQIATSKSQPNFAQACKNGEGKHNLGLTGYCKKKNG
jgi:hypothetical protein